MGHDLLGHLGQIDKTKWLKFGAFWYLIFLEHLFCLCIGTLLHILIVPPHDGNVSYHLSISFA